MGQAGRGALPGDGGQPLPARGADIPGHGAGAGGKCALAVADRPILFAHPLVHDGGHRGMGGRAAGGGPGRSAVPLHLCGAGLVGMADVFPVRARAAQGHDAQGVARHTGAGGVGWCVGVPGVRARANAYF